MKINTPLFPAGDPFLLAHEGKYYLYSTTENDRELSAPNAFDTAIGQQDGFFVYESSNLENWENKGLCLNKNDVFGEKWFWAPEVTFYKGLFYMVFAADEHLAIAVSDSPLGPFTQDDKVYLLDERAIDGHLLIDDDGRIYLYYVKVSGGNKIYVAEMSPDMTKITKYFDDCLIKPTEDWECKDFLVAEGPFVLKHNGIYYLSYSCNHTRSKDYAVGYATATSPFGPFTKSPSNPILHGNKTVYGVGHHSFIYDKENDRIICAYHCHNTKSDNFKPRQFCLTTAQFKYNGTNFDLIINGPEENQ